MRVLQWLSDIISITGGAPQSDIMLDLPTDESELATHTTQSLSSLLAGSGLLSRDKRKYLQAMRTAREKRKRIDTGDTQPINRVSK